MLRKCAHLGMVLRSKMKKDGPVERIAFDCHKRHTDVVVKSEQGLEEDPELPELWPRF